MRRFAGHTGPYIISGKALTEVDFERYSSVSLGSDKRVVDIYLIRAHFCYTFLDYCGSTKDLADREVSDDHDSLRMHC